MYFTVFGTFIKNPVVIAGYVNWMGNKFSAKLGVQTAEMIL